MKTKHILTAMVLPALFAACTQEEVAVEKNAGVDLSYRPVLSDVTLSFDEADTRMSVVDGKDYAITPDAEDGLGACIIDIPTYSSASDYATKLEAAKKENKDERSLYNVTDYISSNYRYDLGADGNWNTQALLSEGNYVFYAPHSEKHTLRMPLSIKVPVEQKATAEEPNKAIKDFYANATEEGYPIVIDYKFLKASEQEKTVKMNYRHILSYPKFTLKNDYTEKEDGKDVKKAVKVTKVAFSMKNGDKFLVEAPLLNGETAKTGIAGKALGGDSLWIKREIEEAATSNVLKTTVAKDIKYSETITVDFGEGIEIAADGTFSFYAVMPAEQYINDTKKSIDHRLVATVYTADNKQFKTKFDLKDLTMNPGKRYPAQEYNTRTGEEEPELKEKPGKLATISLQGEQGPVQAKATGLKDNKELIEYLSKVATRYRDLKQVNSDFAELNKYTKEEVGAGKPNYEKYDSGLHFTLAKDAKIVIDDELIDALIKYIYEDATGGSITFLKDDVEAGKVVLGNTTKLGEYDIRYGGVMKPRAQIGGAGDLKDEYIVEFDTEVSASKITLSTGTTEFKKGMDLEVNRVVVPKDATLTLGDEFAVSSLVVENNGGTVNVGKVVDIASISNNAGTLNLNANFSKAVTNGALETKQGSTDIQEYTNEDLTAKNNGASNKTDYFVKVVSEGTINIAKGVIAGGAVRNNPGSVINNNGFMSAATGNMNAGTIVMGEGSDANIENYEYEKYEGYVKNNAQVAITNVGDKQMVSCELAAVPTETAPVGKFTAARINVINITNDVIMAKDVFETGKVFAGVKEVNFINDNITITTADGFVTGDVANVLFKIHNNITWIGKPMAPVDMSTGVFGIDKLLLKTGKKITDTGVILPTPTIFE